MKELNWIEAIKEMIKGKVLIVDAYGDKVDYYCKINGDSFLIKEIGREDWGEMFMHGGLMSAVFRTVEDYEYELSFYDILEDMQNGEIFTCNGRYFEPDYYYKIEEDKLMTKHKEDCRWKKVPLTWHHMSSRTVWKNIKEKQHKKLKFREKDCSGNWYEKNNCQECKKCYNSALGYAIWSQNGSKI
jgi:hypothetical protein